MDNTRLILFVALSVIILLLWQAWEQENRPPPATAPDTAAQPAGVPSLPAETRAAPTRAQAAADPAGERIQVTTDLLEVEIDTLGGDIRRLALRAHPVAVDQPDQPFVLMTDQGGPLFVSQSGLIGHGRNWPNHKTIYKAAQTRYTLGPDQQELAVPLRWTAADGTEVVKTLRFKRDSYLVDIEYRVRNAAAGARDVYLYAQLTRAPLESAGLFGMIPSYTGGVIYTPADRYEKISFDDMAKRPLARDVNSGWVAMIQHYFLAAWLPPGERPRSFYTEALDANRYAIGYKDTEATRIEPGEAATLATQLYAGPKEQARLEQLAEGLKLTVDYGWLTFLSAPLFWLLQAIHDWVGNWGWAIIILTIIIKLVFHPLSAASYKSMAHMRRVQPKLQALKERYGDDRQKLNQAMMELYKTEKINPLGGCLPILIQIPVFIALYWVLLESVELRQAPFILWLNDLSSADPYFVLPVLMGVTMLAQQWLNPQPLDPLQKKIMMMLPIMFTVFFVFFPAGLVLYWVVQNILSIAQQWWITRRIEAGAR
jgi:YidC/Oxa1 family membrane protein insertase